MSFQFIFQSLFWRLRRHDPSFPKESCLIPCGNLMTCSLVAIHFSCSNAIHPLHGFGMSTLSKESNHISFGFPYGQGMMNRTNFGGRSRYIPRCRFSFRKGLHSIIGKRRIMPKGLEFQTCYTNINQFGHFYNHWPRLVVSVCPFFFYYLDDFCSMLVLIPIESNIFDSGLYNAMKP